MLNLKRLYFNLFYNIENKINVYLLIIIHLMY